MKIKRILGLGLAATTALTMTGCGYKGIEIIIPDELSTEQIEISVWHTTDVKYDSSNNPIESELQKQIKEFNKIYPNIKVNESYQGTYGQLHDKNVAALTAGTQPNLTYAYADNLAYYVESYGVADLNPFIDHEKFGLSAEEKNDFVESYLLEGSSFDTKGTLYSLPFGKSTELMVMNMDVLKAVDGENAKAPTTWNEVYELIDRIEAYNVGKSDSEKLPTTFAYDSGQNQFITLLEQAGLDYTNTKGKILFNTKEAKELMTTHIKDQSANLTNGSILEGYSSTKFLTQDFFMTISSSAGAKYNFKYNNVSSYNKANPSNQLTNETFDYTIHGNVFETQIFPIPQLNADNKKVMSQGPGIAILRNEDQQENLAAWLFLNFITSAESSQMLAESHGYLPIKKSVVENQSYKDFLDSDSSVATAALKLASTQLDYLFTSPAFVGSSAAREQAGEIIDSIIINGDVDKAFKDAMNKLK